MALDPRIALAGRPGQFSLQDFATGMQQGQQLIAGQRELSEQERLLAEQEAIRQAYAQQYGGGGGAPPGLAGAQPMMPVQERRLGGGPTANAPYATPLEYRDTGQPVDPARDRQTMEFRDTGQPVDPARDRQTMEFRDTGQPVDQSQARQTMGLAGVQPMTPADTKGQRAFIDKLYTISPQAGREAETHAFTSQKQQYEANKERVEYLGRIANGVLDSPNPQQAWTVARAMLIEAGMPPGQVPEVVDLNYVRQLSGMALDAKDKYNAGILRLHQAKEQRERTKLASKAPDYGYGHDLDAALYARYGTQLPPGSPPTSAMVQQARQDLIAEKRQEEQEKQQGRVEVAAATGREAAQDKSLGQTAQKRLEALDTAGLTAQTTHTTLDEVDRLIGEGVYGNSPLDRTAMVAYRAGTSPNDTKAQRTARLQELGNQLVLAYSEGGLGNAVSNTDAQIYAKAAGNFKEAKNLQEMRESIKSMRTILNKAVGYANKTRTHYQETGKLPPFEGRAETALSEADITYYMQTWGKTRQEVLDAVRATGSSVPAR